jgi:hypothetical protein
MTSAYNIFVGKPGRRALGKQWGNWEDNIRMHIRKIRWEGADWMNMTEDRGQWWDLVITVMNLRVP